MPLVPTHPPALRTFQVVPIDAFDKACFSNDSETIAIFMLGRLLSDYQLYVNGREYGWGRDCEIRKLEKHLLYCQDMDEVLYEE